jgi:hypothetical protein
MSVVGRVAYRALCSIVLAIVLMGCSGPPTARPEVVESPLTLEILDPPGTQIGLHYGQSVVLRVRYREDIAEKTAVRGQIRFAIFDDPGGSTLSLDRAYTDGDGVASVTLTAGAAERSFRVRASANNASDAEFAISISQLDFVRLDLYLSDPDRISDHTLAALLFEEKHCTELESADSLPPAQRRVQKSQVRDATLTFFNLLSRDYAVVGVAEDENGRVHAHGCAELGASLLPPGTRSALPLPLLPVPIAVTRAFALSTTLFETQESAKVMADWKSLACEYGAAARLLDLLSPHLQSSLAGAIEDLRGRVGIDGCREAEGVQGGTSLDAKLEALLDVPLGLASALPAVVADVGAFVKGAELDSRLAIHEGGNGFLLADHTLEQVTIVDASTAKKSYPLNSLGLPILQDRGVGVTLQDTTLTLGAHDFTLGLPVVWKVAIETQAIGTRFPAILPPVLPNFVTAIFDVASYANQEGCAAIEALICENAATGDCIGAVAPACEAAEEELAATLVADLARPTTFDFRLSGHATVVDSDRDLSAEALMDGTWDSIGAGFVGTQTP